MPATAMPFAAQLAAATYLLIRLTKVTTREPACTIGVDIGSTSIKVVALGPRKGGTRSVIGQNLIPLEAGQEADASEPLRNAV